MADVPPGILERVRSICLGLPETCEEAAWTGVRWRVRKRTFAHVLTIDDTSTSVMRRAFALTGEVTSVTFRVPGEELQALRQAGPPFRHVGWGRDVMAMYLDDTTDWDEVAELLTESFCLLAPKKLVARVDRPGPSD
ncbi:MAG: MmcQ/YjbR family DNA-binding protein [Aeromicrobium sp.]